jgi:hypothetical protein
LSFRRTCFVNASLITIEQLSRCVHLRRV